VRPVTVCAQGAPFEVISDMVPAATSAGGAEISRRIQAGDDHTVLLGATGTGKTATVAWIGEQLQRPMLVKCRTRRSPRQFANDCARCCPKTRSSTFVSYYDYTSGGVRRRRTRTSRRTPRSLRVERLRHSATNSLLTRRDTIVGVLRVVHLTGLARRRIRGSHAEGLRGRTFEREALLRKLVGMQYNATTWPSPRAPPGRGDTIEIIPMYEELASGQCSREIERLMTLHPLTGEVGQRGPGSCTSSRHELCGPAGADGTGRQRIEAELAERLGQLERDGNDARGASGCACATTYDVR